MYAYGFVWHAFCAYGCQGACRVHAMSMSNEHYLSFIRSNVGPIEIELCPTFMCHVMLHWTPKSQYLPMMCTHMAQLTHDFTFIETKVKTDWLPRTSATFSFSLSPTSSWKLCSCVGFSTIWRHCFYHSLLLPEILISRMIRLIMLFANQTS